MDFITGNFDHIEDILVHLHTGQWFGWSDSKNKVYANLVIHGDQEKPTQEFLESELARLQAEYDSQEYARNREAEYASIGDQLDMQYWDSVNDTTTWKDHIASVKDQFPKV
jgi:hypothetical protein